MKKLWSQKFLSKSYKSRSNKIKQPKKSLLKQKVRKSVAKMSKQQMIQFGNVHDICTVREFWKIVHICSDAPTYRQILEEFGSWHNYRVSLKNRGKRKRFIQYVSDQHYIKTCLRFGIKNKRDYMLMRKEYSSIILLSFQELKRRFGCWLNFKKLLRCFDLQGMLQDYVIKSINAGHALTLSQCEQIGLQIKRVMNHYGRNIFNKLLRQKQKQIYKSVLEGKYEELGIDKKAIGIDL